MFLDIKVIFIRLLWEEDDSYYFKWVGNHCILQFFWISAGCFHRKVRPLESCCGWHQSMDKGTHHFYWMNNMFQIQAYNRNVKHLFWWELPKWLSVEGPLGIAVQYLNNVFVFYKLNEYEQWPFNEEKRNSSLISNNLLFSSFPLMCWSSLPSCFLVDHITQHLIQAT